MTSSTLKYFLHAAGGKWVMMICLLLTGPMGYGSCQDDDGGGDDGPEETPVEKTCQQSVISLVTGIIPILPKCLFGGNVINLKLTNIFEALPRIYCVFKCVFAELTVFTPEGTLDEVGALLFFQEAIPEYALPPIVEKAQPCLALADGFKPSQYHCQSYSPFVQCIAGTLVTGIGPFILECFGTPLFAGLFGLLNFVVPPEHNAPGENEVRRRRIGGVNVNRTMIGGSSRSRTSMSRPVVSKLRQRQDMLRRQRQNEFLGAHSQQSTPHGSVNVNALPNFTKQGQDKLNLTTRLVAPEPNAATMSGTSPALFMSNTNNNRRKNANSISMNNASRGGKRPQFSLDFLFKDNHKYSSTQLGQYHTNNTDSVVYQMDRITNLAKTLQLLTNNTAKFFT